jgi:HTH-type transcriptional regulator / antitoxin HipB
MSVMADTTAFTASDLGHLVRAERKAMGLTQQDVARRVGVARQTVIDVEQGKNVSLYVLMGILAGLGKGLRVTDARPSIDDVRAMFDESDDKESDDGQDQDAARRHAPGRGG